MDEALRPRPARAALTAVAALLVLAGLGAALDLDRDGDATWRELDAGTAPWQGDSDGDGLEDGWERAGGLDPLDDDSDGDTVDDGDEAALGSDATAVDSDQDGLLDPAERLLPDCDGDGALAIAEGDGDGDGRLDRLEAAGDRCTRDVDGDGVPDGAEGNDRCVRLADCDGDGLADGDEAATGSFDALDPDSFGSGVSDGISYAFEQSGQPPGADADDDGIPDGWEGDDGLIVWGDLRPVPGQRDLLVEFLRVQGPDSGRQAGLSFVPAYEAVASVLQAERGLRMRWTETVVNVAQETDPALIPQLEDPYYTNVLGQGRHSANPYVTTVVLNPQHDQGEVLHSGVAPIRGMLAAVDYGTQVTFVFTSPRITGTLELEPFVESVIRAMARGDPVAIEGWQTATIDAGGEMVLTRADGLQLRWTPNWFRTNPRVVTPGGEVIPLNLDRVVLGTGSLAGTILHELGHTLGLCHAHEPTCNARYSARDRADQATSTMSYDAPGNLLHFLDSEWSTVLQYISCPPDAPVTTVAEGGGAEQVLEDKYGYADRDVTDVDARECNDLSPVPRLYVAGDPPGLTYAVPAARADVQDDPAGPGLFVLVAVVGLLVAAGLALVAGGWWPRPRP